MKMKDLASVLGEKPEAVKEAVERLGEALSGRGVVLIRTEDEVSLACHPDASAVIEAMEKKERETELGKASLETLAVVLYNAPVARRDIDFIRGVQSQYILRLLTARGLVEKEEKSGAYFYSPSLELLAHLGVARREDLPDFDSIRQKVADAVESQPEEE